MLLFIPIAVSTALPSHRHKAIGDETVFGVSAASCICRLEAIRYSATDRAGAGRETFICGARDSRNNEVWAVETFPRLVREPRWGIRRLIQDASTQRPGWKDCPDTCLLIAQTVELPPRINISILVLPMRSNAGTHHCTRNYPYGGLRSLPRRLLISERSGKPVN